MPDARQLRRAARRAIPAPVRQRLYDWSPSRRRRWRQVPGTETVPASAAAVLTFDDGPDPECTPEVLEALAAAGARATFFVLGEQALEHPELIGSARAAGHEIALHGMTHRRHDRLDADAAAEELRRGIEAIENVAGEPPAWYRPPYGASSPQLAEACRRAGLGLAYWSAWGQDWEESSPQRIARLVRRDLGPGAIVLLHDSARYAQRHSGADTAAAIPLIAAAAAESEIELAPLSAAVDGRDT